MYFLSTFQRALDKDEPLTGQEYREIFSSNNANYLNFLADGKRWVNRNDLSTLLTKRTIDPNDEKLHIEILGDCIWDGCLDILKKLRNPVDGALRDVPLRRVILQDIITEEQLQDRFSDDDFTQRIFRAVITLGDLPTLQWLIETVKVDMGWLYYKPYGTYDYLDSGMFDLAIQHGQLPILQWFATAPATREYFNKKCGVEKWHVDHDVALQTLRTAIQSGHLDMVKWAFDKFGIIVVEKEAKDCISLATNWGHFEIASWLQEKRNQGQLSVAQDILNEDILNEDFPEGRLANVNQDLAKAIRALNFLVGNPLLQAKELLRLITARFTGTASSAHFSPEPARWRDDVIELVTKYYQNTNPLIDALVHEQRMLRSGINPTTSNQQVIVAESNEETLVGSGLKPFGVVKQ